MTSATEKLEHETAELAAAQARLKEHCATEDKAIEGGEEEWERWHREHRRLTLDVERRTKLVSSCKQEVADERRKQLLAQADAQRQANVILAARMQQEGSAIWQQLRMLLQDVAEADIATAKVNASLPSDVERIRTADTIARAREMLPRQDLAERQIDLWVGVETGNPISDQTAVTDLGNGLRTLPSASSAGVLKCARRRYRQVEYYAEEPVQRVEPLIKLLRLPCFDRPGFLWSGDHVRNPQAALELLDRNEPEPKRQVLTELVPEGPWTTPVISRPAPKPKKAAVSGD